MMLMVVGLFLFFAIHLLPTQVDLKRGLIERFGEGGYKWFFAVVALVGLVLIVIGYGKLQDPALTGKNPQLWLPPIWTRHLALLLMIPALILLVAAYVPSNIKQIAGHPMLAAIKIWATAHLLANGDLASVVLFGSFLAYGVVDRISVKRREAQFGAKRAPGGVTGDLIAVAAGLALYVMMLLFLHEWLFGVAPLPGLGA
jgi:uncharacterized membrane protein